MATAGNRSATYRGMVCGDVGNPVVEVACRSFKGHVSFLASQADTVLGLDQVTKHPHLHLVFGLFQLVRARFEHLWMSECPVVQEGQNSSDLLEIQIVRGRSISGLHV